MPSGRTRHLHAAFRILGREPSRNINMYDLRMRGMRRTADFSTGNRLVNWKIARILRPGFSYVQNV